MLKDKYLNIDHFKIFTYISSFCKQLFYDLKPYSLAFDIYNIRFLPLNVPKNLFGFEMAYLYLYTITFGNGFKEIGHKVRKVKRQFRRARLSRYLGVYILLWENFDFYLVCSSVWWGFWEIAYQRQ